MKAMRNFKNFKFSHSPHSFISPFLIALFP
nr:MAG TPA: hypothetical protein [Caudoviricetes sp.]